MCGSMADIQSAAAEIRRGKKRRKNKPQHENTMVCPIPYGDHNQVLIMAALCNRAGHHNFALWFLLSSSFFLSFFPRLISAVRDWMSTILPHMVWPHCEFRMQVWSVLHAARWKCRTQTNRHLRTIAQLCRAISSQLRHVSTLRKKIVKQQYLPHVFTIWWTLAH